MTHKRWEEGAQKMQYLKSFTLPSENAEAGYLLGFPPELEMQCYAGSAYPFKVFPQKKLCCIEFEPITVFYGGNGSGKSTLLNVIAGKLSLDRSAPFNNSPCMEAYLGLCGYELMFGRKAPPASRIITSDDVFDYLLDVRAVNEKTERLRGELFDEYQTAKSEHFQLRSIDEYEELRRHNEAKKKTKSQYVSRRMKNELPEKSNGESAYAYFTDMIKQDALYLLDEPENSLSAKLQRELAAFISDSVRFYNCQFVISSHSPFILSMRDAAVYDLDSFPARRREWAELENVRAYYELFESRREEFRDISAEKENTESTK